MWKPIEIKELAKELSEPDVHIRGVANAFKIEPTQIASLITREIRNGDLLGLSPKELMQLSDNLGDTDLTKVIKNKLAKQANLVTSNDPKSLADLLETLQKRLSDRRLKGKPKSKLVNSKKTKIPGFSTYFRKE